MRRLRVHLSRYLKKLRTAIRRINKARGSDHEIALGAAIGAYWGVFPTFGLSTVLTLAMYRFIRFNVLVALSAAFISNPLTSPFLLVSSFRLGAFLIGSGYEFDPENWQEDLPRFGYAMLVGSFVLSSLTALLIYGIARISLSWKKNLVVKKQS